MSTVTNAANQPMRLPWLPVTHSEVHALGFSGWDVFPLGVFALTVDQPTVLFNFIVIIEYDLDIAGVRFLPHLYAFIESSSFSEIDLICRFAEKINFEAWLCHKHPISVWNQGLECVFKCAQLHWKSRFSEEWFVLKLIQNWWKWVNYTLNQLTGFFDVFLEVTLVNFELCF